MIAMVIAPCGDAAETGTPHQNEQFNETSITFAVNLECDSDNHQEDCSPLCPCQCCPSINSYAIGLSGQIINFPLAHLTENNIPVSSDISLLIWSPPRLLS